MCTGIEARVHFVLPDCHPRRLSYEDLVENRGPTQRSLFSFMEIATDRIPQPLSITIKQSSKPMRKAIENFEELRFAFSNTRLGPDFD
jgi:hypothetical protein